MQIVVALGGDLHDSPLVRSALSGAGLIVAADSGAERLLSIGIQCQIVIGDFDSLDPAELWRLRSGGVEIVAHPAPQQRTDADVAIELALQRGATSLIVLGAFGGGRIDHTLGNLDLLTHPSLRGIPTWAVDGWSALTILRGDGIRETHFHGHPGDYVSIIPLSDHVAGVTAVGLKWPLQDARLERGRAQGVSNELIADRAMIQVGEGIAGAVHHFRTERLP